MMSLLKKFKNFEIHHKIIFFIIILILTIGLTRIIVQIHNPNPSLFGFEIHHFDYGLLLLILTLLLLLFGKKHDFLYLIMGAISIGLIVDDIWFVRKMVVENDVLQTGIYNSTLFSAIILLIAVSFVIVLIDSIRRKR